MMIYLGFDASTQGLALTAIEADAGRRAVLFERSLDYDEALPHCHTRHGVLADADPLVAVSPPLMWAEALDRMIADIASERPFDLARVAAISGSAQQHGSVYLTAAAGDCLAALDPSRPLPAQIESIFARDVSPIWMDASTTRQCAAITEAVGGADVLARLTGSRAFERFAGPQIRKFWEMEPGGYGRTDRIHLVSSYLASLLAGRHAPIDPCDGSGMNLMDIAARQWSQTALEATAPDLARRLPPIAPSWTVVGPPSRYWRERYGLPPARVIAWSGDNPCSLVGTGIVHEGDVAISLGTSDTIFAAMSEARIDPSGVAHVFGSPTGEYMGLTCFRNGGLARERVRDGFGMDWPRFSAALRQTPPGNGRALMLPWFEPEITPHVSTAGVRRCNLDASDGPANVRAIIEGQMMAIARHSQWMGVRIARIHATGGAAANEAILRVMADVFDADVYTMPVRNSASLGAALRAFHADRLAEGRPIDWDEVVADFARPDPRTRVCPIREHVGIYEDLKKQYAAFEAEALGVASS